MHVVVVQRLGRSPHPSTLTSVLCKRTRAQQINPAMHKFEHTIENKWAPLSSACGHAHGDGAAARHDLSSVALPPLWNAAEEQQQPQPSNQFTVSEEYKTGCWLNDCLLVYSPPTNQQWNQAKATLKLTHGPNQGDSCSHPPVHRSTGAPAPQPHTSLPPAFKTGCMAPAPLPAPPNPLCATRRRMLSAYRQKATSTQAT